MIKNISLCDTYVHIMWHMASQCFEFFQKNAGSMLSSAFCNVSQLELGKLQRQQIFLGAKQTSPHVKKCWWSPGAKKKKEKSFSDGVKKLQAYLTTLSNSYS